MVKLQIHCFIIDKAHQYLENITYQKYMAGMDCLQSLHGQFFFTSGTLKPCQEFPLLAPKIKTFQRPMVRLDLFLEIRYLKIHNAEKEEMVDLVEREWCMDS
jgi:hypothetical protein